MRDDVGRAEQHQVIGPLRAKHRVYRRLRRRVVDRVGDNRRAMRVHRPRIIEVDDMGHEPAFPVGCDKALESGAYPGKPCAAVFAPKRALVADDQLVGHRAPWKASAETR